MNKIKNTQKFYYWPPVYMFDQCKKQNKKLNASVPLR